MTRILVVDDEQDLCEILRFNLTNEGFDVTTANSAEEALELMENTHSGAWGLILLDVMMDRMSGFDMARHLRQHGDNTPITKPFAFDTVLARVRAVLKRTHSLPSPTHAPLSFGSISIDTQNNTVSLNGSPIELTFREYSILCLLAQRPNKYFSRDEILSAVWPNDALVNDRSVDVHIARLRKKMGKEGRRIVNRTGFGYAISTHEPKN